MERLETVEVPDEYASLFEAAQELVGRYFGDLKREPQHGTIEISGERYLLVRAGALSVEFFDMVRELYGAKNEGQALTVARSLLFDVAHGMGMNDARALAERMDLQDPIAQLSAGPVHFAHTGWASVTVHSMSRPTPDQDYYLVYDHPRSFESDTWISAGRHSDSPVCLMNAGYSSGWCESSFGIPLVASEVLCRARGDEHCRFIMAPPGRIKGHIDTYRGEHPEQAPAMEGYTVPGFFSRQRQEQATELALRESRQLTERVVEALPGGILQVDRLGKVLLANREFLRFIGRDEESTGSANLADVAGRVVREDGTALAAHDFPALQAVATGEPQGPHILGIQLASDDVRWGIFNSIPTKDPGSGETSGAIVTVLDITERKRKEEERRQFDSQLQQAQKLESLGVLAGGIAHDFNNLLVGVIANASLLKRRLGEDPESIKIARQIENAAQRAADLTKQLLAYSGKGRFQIRPIDLSEMVEEMTDLLRASVPKGVTLRADLAAELPAVAGDAAQIQQVVMNLILNGAESIEGEGTVSVKTGRVQLDRRMLDEHFVAEELKEGEYIFMDVTDSGAGMDAETLGRIFDPFFTTKFSGRGLGLAAVLGIIRGHDGGIRIDSTLGKGSHFRIVLPASDRPPVRRRKQSSQTLPAVGRGRRVLVVDDEATVRDATGRILQALGYEVVTACDGPEGLRIFGEEGPRLTAVILDLTMPGLDGAEVFKRMRTTGPIVPTILSSGYAEEEVTSRYALLGLAGFLEKPYTARQLQSKLEEAVASQAPQ